MRRILFQGKTCVKVISHYKHPKMEAEVTPLVVIQDGKDPWGEDELQWGMVLQCTPQLLLEEDKTGVSLGEPFELGNTYSGWNEPILWWRVLQLFEVIHAIDHHFHLDLLIASNAVESFNIHREHPEWTYRPLPINEGKEVSISGMARMHLIKHLEQTIQQQGLKAIYAANV